MVKRNSMSQRPYFSLSINDLEVLAKNHWEDKTFLGKLKRELEHRKTPRAKRLKAEIGKIISANVEKMSRTVKFCDECGEVMEIKHGKHGMFWGCTGYPHCENSIKITKKNWE
jgi:hypothetical protein